MSTLYTGLLSPTACSNLATLFVLCFEKQLGPCMTIFKQKCTTGLCVTVLSAAPEREWSETEPAPFSQLGPPGVPSLHPARSRWAFTSLLTRQVTDWESLHKKHHNTWHMAMSATSCLNM